MLQRSSRRGPVAPPARFGQRVEALRIDGILLGLVALVIRFLLWAGQRSNLLGGALETSGLVGPLAVPVTSGITLGMTLGIGIVYYVWCERSPRGATIGKLWVGISVIDERSRRPSTIRVVVRTLGKALSLLPCGIGFLLPLVTRQRQAPHDLLAGTVVVRVGESRDAYR